LENRILRELIIKKLNQVIIPATHLLGLLLNLVLLLLFFYYHDHGFDLTDEGFYALNATQYDNIIIGLSFGYLTSYLMGLFSCDFHDTRIIGYILLLVSTILMTSSCLYKYTGKFSYNKLLTAVAISTTCIILYSHGIYSLSYNSYSVFGVNFILTGLFLNKDSKILSFQSLITGFGIFLLGMSKFTIIPIFLLLIIILYFFDKDKKDLKIFINGSIFSLLFLLLHFFISNDSVELFTRRFILTYESLSLLKSNHNEQFSLPFIISNLKEYILRADTSILTIYSICPIYLLICLKNKNRKIYLFSTMLVASLISYPILSSLKRWVWHIDFTFIFFFTQFIIICIFVKLTNCNFKRYNKLLYLLFAPTLYAIGSNNGLSFGGYLTLFWPITAIFVLYTISNNFKPIYFSIQLAGTICLALVSAFHGFKHPYRVDGRISQQSSNITSFDGKHDMVIETMLSEFVTKLHKEAKSNGWKSNTPLIELTNRPGLTFLLSGKIVSTPWLLAGYDGSEQYAKKMLDLYERNDLASAWVLTSENKNPSLPTHILNDVGLNFPSNYNEIKIGNYNGNHYSLWKPSA
jgi:hypothetical protein